MLASFLVVLFVVPLIFVVVIPSLMAYFWIQKIYRHGRSRAPVWLWLWLLLLWWCWWWWW